jgi:protease-4
VFKGKIMVNQNQASRSVIGIFVLIIILFFIFIFFSFSVVNSLRVSDKEGASFEMMGADKSPIAVIEVLGPIMDAKDIVELLHQAEQDESVKVVIVRVDSPGGAVGPTQEIYEEIVRLDKIKPVYASFGSIAASGGYYIGAATRRIYASNGTLTGSIGVIMSFVDLSKLFEWGKIQPQVMKAGKYKDIGSPNRPMNAEEQELLNAMLNQVHERFREDILLKRKDKIKADIVEITQGQIFNGEEALKLGLVDEVAGLWEAARRIQKELKLKGDTKKLRFLKKEKAFSWGEFLNDLEETSSNLKNLSLGYSVPMFR